MNSRWRRLLTSNENKMSCGGRGRAPLRVEVFSHGESLAARGPGLSCIAWLALFDVRFRLRMILKDASGTAQQKPRDDNG